MNLKFMKDYQKTWNDLTQKQASWICLVTSTAITTGVSTAAFTSGVGLPVGIALSGTSLTSQKALKIFTVRQEKHDAINLLAQSKLA